MGESGSGSGWLGICLFVRGVGGAFALRCVGRASGMVFVFDVVVVGWERWRGGGGGM